MKAKAKSFLQFINENHDDSSDLADLESLYSLGMMDEDQYYSEAVRVLKSMGVISSSVPNVSINIDSSFEGATERETKVMSDLVRDWTGRYGERILELTMNLDDDEGKTRILLDIGIDCTFIHSPDGWWFGTSVEISVADQVFTEQDILRDYVYDDDEPGEDDVPFYATYADTFEFMLNQICKMYDKMAIDSLLKRVI